jgi:transposase InsO family protein
MRDLDTSYGAAVTRRLRAMGIRDRPIMPRSPWQNGHVERLIGSSDPTASTMSWCWAKATSAICWRVIGEVHRLFRHRREVIQKALDTRQSLDHVTGDAHGSFLQRLRRRGKQFLEHDFF